MATGEDYLACRIVSDFVYDSIGGDPVEVTLTDGRFFDIAFIVDFDGQVLACDVSEPSGEIGMGFLWQSIAMLKLKS